MAIAGNHPLFNRRNPHLQIPSLKLTWHWKITPWKRILLLEIIIFRGYVSFREGTCLNGPFQKEAAKPSSKPSFLRRELADNFFGGSTIVTRVLGNRERNPTLLLYLRVRKAPTRRPPWWNGKHGKHDSQCFSEKSRLPAPIWERWGGAKIFHFSKHLQWENALPWDFLLMDKIRQNQLYMVILSLIYRVFTIPRAQLNKVA